MNNSFSKTGHDDINKKMNFKENYSLYITVDLARKFGKLDPNLCNYNISLVTMFSQIHGINSFLEKYFNYSCTISFSKYGFTSSYEKPKIYQK